MLTISLILALLVTATVPSEGLVVENVEDWAVGAQAGIQPGDILLTWEVKACQGLFPCEGRFLQPFDYELVFREIAPRGAVRITLARGTNQLPLTLDFEPWGLTVRPLLDREQLSLFEDGIDFIDSEQYKKAGIILRKVVSQLEKRGQPKKAAWVLYALGNRLRLANQFAISRQPCWRQRWQLVQPMPLGLP